MTKTLAMELGKFNIRVNAICPGTVKGDRMGRVIRDKAKFLKISKIKKLLSQLEHQELGGQQQRSVLKKVRRYSFVMSIKNL